VCKYCGGKGVLEDKSRATITFCPHCVDARKIMQAISAAIKQAKSIGDKSTATGLTAINKFLPKYSVMAVMEAEARGFPKSFINILSHAFGVKRLL